MGLPYIEPIDVDSTLKKIIHDPRLPGGLINTEYVQKLSTREEEHMEERGNGEEGSTSSCPGTSNEDEPPWLRQQNSPKSHTNSPKKLCL